MESHWKLEIATWPTREFIKFAYKYIFLYGDLHIYINKLESWLLVNLKGVVEVYHC